MAVKMVKGHKKVINQKFLKGNRLAKKLYKKVLTWLLSCVEISIQIAIH